MGTIVYEPRKTMVVAQEPVVKLTNEEVLNAIKPVAKAMGEGIVKVGVSIVVLRVASRMIENVAVVSGVPAPAIPFIRVVSNTLILYVGGRINGNNNI